MTRRKARIITVTVAQEGPDELACVRVAGPGGEATWAMRLDNWRDIVPTVMDAVSAELGQALGELQDELGLRDREGPSS